MRIEGMNMQTLTKQEYATFDEKLTRDIIQIVGKDNVITDIEGIYAYSFDCAHIPFTC